MPRRSIPGLRVLVTGASSGIGRELALQLASQGAKVVAFARREERLKELVAVHEKGSGVFGGSDPAKSKTLAAKDSRPPRSAISSAREGLQYVAGDVTDSVSRRRALEFCKATLGGLDCLINNAGIGAIGPFAEADEARLRQIMEVNFFAPVELTRAALSLLRQGNKPLVVNVCSVLGHRAVPSKSEYCASKFALHGFSDALRAELSREKIDVLLVSPATTQSEFFDQVIGDKQKPHGRLGAMTPAKVARRTIRAMQSGRHEIILPFGGKLLVWLDRLCPPLADRLVAWFG